MLALFIVIVLLMAGKLYSVAATMEIAIINMVPFHHEVYPAFHYAWQRNGYNITSYVYGGTVSNMTAVTKSWGFSFEDIRSFPRRFCKFKILIFTSVEYGRDFLMASRILQSVVCRGKQKYVFVIHNPGVMRDSRRGPSKLLPLVAENPNVHLVGLGPHTTAAINSILANNGHKKKVDYIIPLFPIDSTAGGGKHSGFVLQGSISDRRRSYRKLIDSIAQPDMHWPLEFQFSVLGKGNISIPNSAAQYINLEPGLAYPEYYNTIQQSLGLLTAFASKIYFREKASSTIAASLICGTPLITESETLNVYSYLSENSTWLRRGSETDVSIMQRIMALKEKDLDLEYRQRWLSLQEDIERAYSRNDATIEKIMKNLVN